MNFVMTRVAQNGKIGREKQKHLVPVCIGILSMVYIKVASFFSNPARFAERVGSDPCRGKLSPPLRLAPPANNKPTFITGWLAIFPVPLCNPAALHGAVSGLLPRAVGNPRFYFVGFPTYFTHDLAEAVIINYRIWINKIVVGVSSYLPLGKAFSRAKLRCVPWVLFPAYDAVDGLSLGNIPVAKTSFVAKFSPITSDYISTLLASFSLRVTPFSHAVGTAKSFRCLEFLRAVFAIFHVTSNSVLCANCP